MTSNASPQHPITVGTIVNRGPWCLLVQASLPPDRLAYVACHESGRRRVGTCSVAEWQKGLDFSREVVIGMTPKDLQREGGRHEKARRHQTEARQAAATD